MRNNLKKCAWALFLLIGAVSYVQAQMVITGTITDSSDFPVEGALITAGGLEAYADMDGVYELEVSASDAVNGTVNLTIDGIDGSSASDSFPYVEGQTVTKDYQIGSIELEQVVAIGYGSVKKEDATGAVDLITSEDFNNGQIVTAENLLNGRAAGVQITNGGKPGDGAAIRIRGGASLDANNQPLIVIDGLPIDGSAPGGSSNVLGSINPNDIESFSILKDASATAIYGSRASNGVIIITTKKGKSGGWKYNYNGQVSLNTLPFKIGVLNGDQFRETVLAYDAANGTDFGSRLGSENTDWQDQIYEDAISTAHSFSARGTLGANLPARISVGYTNTPGILKTSSYDRKNVGVSLTPSFWDDHINVELNANYSNENFRFADEGSIADAIRFDPTQPVRTSSDLFGGYYEYLNPTGDYVTLAPKNPLAKLMMRDNTAEINRFYGNVKTEYKMHFLPDLKAVVNLGYDTNKSHGEDLREPGLLDGSAIQGTISEGTYENRGSYSYFDQYRDNKLMDAYLNYSKTLNGIITAIDVTGGYTWQEFRGFQYNSGATLAFNFNPETDPDLDRYDDLNLQSFFGRVNFTMADKYLFTFSFRRDGTSRFSPENRWGNFPAAAFAWQADKEDFIKNSSWLSSLKVRMGWGITGQQDIGAGPRNYLGSMGIGNTQSSFIFGSGDPFFTPYPFLVSKDLKWEETMTYNLGFDYGIFNNRFRGALEGYIKNSYDLLAYVPLPSGSNYANEGPRNFGDFTTKGVEFSIMADVIRAATSKQFAWDLSYNVAYNDMEVTRLADGITRDVGTLEGLTAQTIQRHVEGYEPFSYYVFQQVYDNAGNPLEGVFVDRNNDGVINNDDRYLYKSRNPKWLMGLRSDMYYRNFDLSLAFRANLGQYVYNNVRAVRAFQQGAVQATYNSNLSDYYLEDGFLVGTVEKSMSDYFVENGSFLKLDNVTLGYTFQNFFDVGNLKVYGSVNNVFTVSNYSGDDPEVFSGIDYLFYPRTRVYTFGVNFNF